ncbi:helix-turn-helix domain-containing protein [Arthrobacter woluwensis]|uniref:helix-turn-helix domain-containing protein n=1 Tax=Arthrobacter woluwensis TaxID=156980 RepID=UPI001AAFA5C7|nr:helix-turn-helix domain-containing protein [Arthrobacter woluwensis]
MEPSDDLYLHTPEEVAELFRVGTDTVWRKCRNREWPHMRIGRHYRFSKADILAIQDLLRPVPVKPRARTKREPL